MILSRNMLKRMGESRHPCRTQLLFRTSLLCCCWKGDWDLKSMGIRKIIHLHCVCFCVCFFVVGFGFFFGNCFLQLMKEGKKSYAHVFSNNVLIEFVSKTFVRTCGKCTLQSTEFHGEWLRQKWAVTENVDHCRPATGSSRRLFLDLCSYWDDLVTSKWT